MARSNTQGNDSMAPSITSPEHMNSAFADAFNSRSLAHLLALYEPGAVLRTSGDGTNHTGLDAITSALSQLLQAPGRMASRNHFCIIHGDLALLRADWELTTDDGAVVASGSSAELVRKQGDGRWLYVIDHAVGAGQCNQG
ncbi:nuclear transport factor 2 family protein [Delftia sp. UME58]|uniref:YybH family protein n=1 Tax=Delftia sp. UME58 TaxID=1862322 RepID=UPI001C7E5B9F|nr:nuclear transport factor 2 family protein [Delftia sp. UME58]